MSINKPIRVIESCRTLTQLTAAEKYVELWLISRPKEKEILDRLILSKKNKIKSWMT